MGVDVMRWLYCAHKPENNLLFGYQRADEVRRQFLIPALEHVPLFRHLCNLDGWEPGHEDFNPACPKVRPLRVIIRSNLDSGTAKSGDRALHGESHRFRHAQRHIGHRTASWMT